MMGFNRRAIAIAVVVAGAFVAACANDESTYGSAQQELVQVTASGGTTFPNTQVGQQSGPLPFYVSPADFSYNTVTNITESCPDFSVVSPGFPQYPNYEYYCEPCYDFTCYEYGQNCYYIESGSFQFQVYYAPVVAAQTSCTITIENSAGNSVITVYGTGTPPPARLSAGPGSINFGEVRNNTTSNAAAVHITNTGGLTMNVGSVTVAGNPPWFSMNTTGGTQVGGGQTATYYVYCSPTSIGGNSGTVSISTDAGSASIPVYCSSIDSNLNLAPSPAQVPTTRVGEPMIQSITLQNSGGATMNVESVTLTGEKLQMMGAAPTGGYSSGGSQAVQVRFAADVAGSTTGELRVTYDGGQVRTVAIAAQALATSMSVTPDVSHDLGQVCAGATATREFNVLATEAGPFKVTDVVPPDEPFTLVAPALPGNVQGSGGNTFKFTVGFAPTTAGEFNSKVDVTTDIPGGSPREIKLRGIAIPEGVNGPELVMLGGAPVGTTTIGRPVSITNCSMSSVTLAGGRIESPAGDEGAFSIVQEPMDVTLDPGETAEWLVVFRPLRGGTLTSNFVAQDASGTTVTIPLTGDGLIDDGDVPGGGGTGADVTPSYYACSTGTATTAWPLALVLPLIVRRRRRA